MRFFALFLFFCGCQTHSPPINWEKVYEKELQIAIENDDREAYRFFFLEYLKEKSKNLQVKPLGD